MTACCPAPALSSFPLCVPTQAVEPAVNALLERLGATHLARTLHAAIKVEWDIRLWKARDGGHVLQNEQQSRCWQSRCRADAGHEEGTQSQAPLPFTPGAASP